MKCEKCNDTGYFSNCFDQDFHCDCKKVKKKKRKQKHHKNSIGETIKLLQSYVENGRIELVSVNLEEIEKALKMSS